MRLGIISALHEEQQGLVEAMQRPYKLIHGMREYWVGQLWEIDAVCVLSRIGKVAAAMTATTLVEKFGVTHILFTGVAGSGDASCASATSWSPNPWSSTTWMPVRCFRVIEVPLTGLTHFESDRQMALELADAPRRFLEMTSTRPSRKRNGPHSPERAAAASRPGGQRGPVRQ
jgi:adenosylhomocysteine nucleosidase